MDLVKLTNTGTVPVDFNGNDRFVIQPGGSKIVTWEVACAWLGDPQNFHEMFRPMEFRLTRSKWGYMDGFHTDDSWEEDRPKIEVTTLDGERIWMLLEDPAGVQPFPGSTGIELTDIQPGDIAALKAQLARQEEQMQRLMALIAAQSDIAPATTDTGTADGSGTVSDADANALSTVATTDAAAAAAADAGGPGTELPVPVATPAGAQDAPQATSTRRVR